MYDAAQNSKDSFNLAVETLRQMYLAERLPGETAKQWLERRKA